MPSVECRPRLSALAICNKIAATGAIRGCRLEDAGNGASQAGFGTSSSVEGFVLVARDQAAYDRMLGGFQSGQHMEFGTSDKALALVVWGNGDERAELEIRLTLAQIDAE